MSAPTVLGIAVAIAAALAVAPTPVAYAQACSDVEVVFARGTTEPVGIGSAGQAFVDALKPKLGSRSLGIYAVQYPASTDWPTAVQGINDASAHIQATAANCPATKLVLGGYSQGAAVIGFTTASVVPAGATDYNGNGPMPPDVAQHVAAVALFGKPSPTFMGAIGEPAVTVGPLYAAKTIEECVPKDPVCSEGQDLSYHFKYVTNGLVARAADFVAGKL
jgi:cutinase